MKISFFIIQVYSITTTGTLPQNRAFHQSINYGNKIIIFGGLNQSVVFNDYAVFNTLSKIWFWFNVRTTTNTLGQRPSPREKCTLTKINADMLILFGGYECSEDETVEINYQDTFSLNLIRMLWEKIDTNGAVP